jgi:drug/metabolite transporter (DMT)-like permease
VPVFAALSSRVLWKEKLSIFTILALIIGLSGIVLIAKPTFLFGASNDKDKKEYDAYFPLVPVTGGLMLGFSFSCMRRVGTEVSSIFVSVVVSSTAAVDAIIFQLISGEIFVLPSCFIDRLVLCSGGVGLFIMLILLNRGLSLEKSGPGVLIRNCDIVIAYGIQVIFFDSIPDVLSIVGALLVISSAVLVTVNKLFIEKFFKYEI